MKWLMNTGTVGLLVILLGVATAMAALTAIGCFFFAWRKRFVEEAPVPHCNLQERLAQIAQAPMVLGRKLDLPIPSPHPAETSLDRLDPHNVDLSTAPPKL
jgi:hypothetical protein